VFWFWEEFIVFCGAFFRVLSWGDFGGFGVVRGDRGLVSPRLLVVGYHLVDWMFWDGGYDKCSLSVAAKRGFVIN